GAVCLGTDVHVMGAGGDRKETYTYDTVGKRWTKGRDMPGPASYTRACLISPYTVLVHSNNEILVGTCQEEKERPERERQERLERERLERQERERQERERLEGERLERLEREEQQRLEAARSRLTSGFLTLLQMREGQTDTPSAGADTAGTGTPTPLEETASSLAASAESLSLPVLDLIVSHLVSLETQRHSESAAFSAFTPSMLSDMHSLIEEVKAFDAECLLGHITQLEAWLPVVEGIHPAAQGLEGFMEAHPQEELVSSDCASLSATLSPLYSSFHALHTALQGVECDPKGSVPVLQAASALLHAVSAASIITLPSDMGGMDLEGKRKYRQIEHYNTAVRTLLDIVGPVIDCKAAIEACMQRLEGVVYPDIDALGALEAQAVAVTERLVLLSDAQAQAETLLPQLAEIEVVSDTSIEEAEDEVCVLTFTLEKRRHLSDEERERLAGEVAECQQRIASMRHAQEERARLTALLEPLSYLPSVASALGLDPGPVPQAKGWEGEVGMMVRACDRPDV
ncbi:hypothetical protein KIPB_005941, partial [Kipferlia bialata]